MQPPIPVSLYIHFPWCIQKCRYCDFNSYAISSLPEKQYLNALILDLKQELQKTQTTEFCSIYLGGGTPSLFSSATIAMLLNEIAKLSTFTSNTEISIEVNPGTVDLKKLRDLFACGINRISIGIQSFQDDKLASIGRIHDANQAKITVLNAQRAGFENINLDLIYGLPQQTTIDAMRDLQQAIDLNPTHLSWYQLTIEPNTYFAHHPPKLPNEETIINIANEGEQLLINNSFNHYEISAFSKVGYQCKHNLNYWHFGDYLGIGAGAHGKITSNNTIKRNSKIKLPNSYMTSNNNFVAEETTLTPQDLITEFMINTLRLYSKVPISLFTERTKLPLSTIKPKLNQAQKQGFIVYNDEFFLTTKLGKQFLNQTLTLF